MGRRPRAIEARENGVAARAKEEQQQHGEGEGEARGAEPLTACLEGERGGGAATWPRAPPSSGSLWPSPPGGGLRAESSVTDAPPSALGWIFGPTRPPLTIRMRPSGRVGLTARLRAGVGLGGRPPSRPFMVTGRDGRPTIEGLPAARGLYSPHAERDSCGTGFVVDVQGEARGGGLRRSRRWPLGDRRAARTGPRVRHGFCACAVPAGRCARRNPVGH